MGLVARLGDCAVTVAMEMARDICLSGEIPHTTTCKNLYKTSKIIFSGPVSVRTLVQTLRDKQNVGLQDAYRYTIN